MKRWAVIYNPVAGGFRPRRLRAIVRELAARGIAAQPLPTGRRGHATEMCREISGVDTVAVYGGDGTLNEAANGLLGRDLPLAFLPGGTANVMAHELGLPGNPARAAGLLAGGQARPVHPGTVSGRAFLLMAGFGFDAAAVHGVSPALKSAAGRLAYVWAALRALAAAPADLRLTLDGAAIPGGAWVIASRSAHYAGPFVLDHAAGLERPDLSVVVVPRRGILPFLAANLALGARTPWGGARILHGRRLLVESAAPAPAQVDGDASGASRAFTVEIATQVLWLRFPTSAQM
jgi:diacylglycerol kinase family enzyme